LGLPAGGSGFGSAYWVGLIISTVCFGLLNLGLMAGTGALGGLLWNQFNKKSVPPPSSPVQ
jgi:hypothetical protein